MSAQERAGASVSSDSFVPSTQATTRPANAGVVTCGPTTSAGRSSARSSASAMLPMTARASPPRPCEVMQTRLAGPRPSRMASGMLSRVTALVDTITSPQRAASLDRYMPTASCSSGKHRLTSRSGTPVRWARSSAGAKARSAAGEPSSGTTMSLKGVSTIAPLVSYALIVRPSPVCPTGP
jgi:hypothetical protein